MAHMFLLLSLGWLALFGNAKSKDAQDKRTMTPAAYAEMRARENGARLDRWEMEVMGGYAR